MIWLWTVWGEKSRRIWNESQLQQPKQAQLWWCLSHARTPGVYLVLVCALLELFELVVKHGEMPSDALYPSMQTPVLTVFGIEIVFIPLALLRRADHQIFPIGDIERMSEAMTSEAAPFPAQSLKELDTYDKYSAASGDEEETPLLLAHVPFKPETSSIRKMARFSVFKEKQTLPLHLHKWLQLTTFTHLIHWVKASVRSACMTLTLTSGCL